MHVTSDLRATIVTLCMSLRERAHSFIGEWPVVEWFLWSNLVHLFIWNHLLYKSLLYSLVSDAPVLDNNVFGGGGTQGQNQLLSSESRSRRNAVLPLRFKDCA